MDSHLQPPSWSAYSLSPSDSVVLSGNLTYLQSLKPTDLCFTMGVSPL